MANADNRGWGKLNAGQPWTIVALDVDRALAMAKMTDYEQIVMQYVREYSWGSSTKHKQPGKAHPWPDARPAVWRPSELALRTGIPAPRLVEAKQRLIQSRMLDEPTRGGLLVNKNADQWIFPEGHLKAEKPRLDSTAIAYAMAARPAPEAPENLPESIRPQLRKSVTHRSSSLRKSVTPITEIRNSNYGNPERSLRKSVTPLSSKGAQEDPTGLDVCVDVPDDTHANQDKAPHLLPPEDQARIDEASRLADDWFPMRELGGTIARNANLFNPKVAGSFPTVWLRPALERLRAQPVGRHTWAYFQGILRGFVAEGGPSPTTAVPSVNGQHAAPPSRIAERDRRTRDLIRQTFPPKSKPKE